MLKILAIIFLSATLLCGFALNLAVDRAPAVSIPPLTTPEDISQLKKILKKSNPFKFQHNKNQAIIVNEKLLNQAANFTLSQLPISTITQIKLNNNSAHAIGSIKLPLASNAYYINISTDISPTNNLFKISNLKIGSIPVPDFLINELTPLLMQYAAKHYQEYISLLDAVKKLDISENKLTINYHWNTGLSKKLKIAGRNFLLPPKQQERIRIYYQALGKHSLLYYWQPLDLDRVIQPIFKLAHARSRQGEDPVKENEAAILALGIMASGIRANHLLQDLKTTPMKNAYFFRLSLLGRRDLMQHFLISAALTVSTNIALSDNIGLSKEMDDSKSNSGFSFADLLADRAGVRLTEIATRNTASALRIQSILSNTRLTESDFMPTIRNLPESISALEFKNQYIDIRHKKYLFVEKELHRRISSTKLHHQP